MSRASACLVLMVVLACHEAERHVIPGGLGLLVDRIGQDTPALQFGEIGFSGDVTGVHGRKQRLQVGCIPEGHPEILVDHTPVEAGASDIGTHSPE